LTAINRDDVMKCKC